MTRLAYAAALSAALSGCFGDYHPDPPDASSDARSDVALDRSDVASDLAADHSDVVDATPDVAPDVTPDVALDATSDGSSDVTVTPDVIDASLDLEDVIDASLDAEDATIDAPADAAIDARTDAVSDARADVVSDAASDARADVADVTDAADASDPVDPLIEAPRPLEPLSAMRALRRVRFGWALAPSADGAQIDVCRDRACSTVELSVSATGETLTTTADLTPGYHFWRLRGRRGRAIGTAFSPVWEFYVSPRRPGFTTPLPRQWGAMPDVNADGRSDLIAGAPSSTATGLRTGVVYVFAGSTDRFATTPLTPLVTSLGTGSYGRFVTPIADINGDGYGDLAAAGATVVAIHHGASAGPSSAPTRVYDTWRSVAGGGDINHDGYGDVIVGNGSTVGVILGGAGGAASAPVRTVSGTSAVAIGDVNSDGYDDLCVQTATTRLSVYLGNLAGFDATASYTLDAPSGYTLSNLALAGDVNGDGVADVIATATPLLGSLATPVVFLLVPPATRAIAPVQLNPPSPRPTGWASAVAGAGDFNGDGVDDMIVGSGGGATAEAVCVYAGSATGPATAPTQCITMSATTHFGASVGGVGDLNADGFEDVIAGAPGSSTVGGSVMLYRGRAAGLTDPALAPWTAGETAAAFGTSVGAWR